MNSTNLRTQNPKIMIIMKTTYYARTVTIYEHTDLEEEQRKKRKRKLDFETLLQDLTKEELLALKQFILDNE